MKKFIKKGIFLTTLLLTSFAVNACGKDGQEEPESYGLAQLAEPIPENSQSGPSAKEASDTESSEAEAPEEQTPEAENKISGTRAGENTTQTSAPAGGSLIEEQTFHVTLQPLGAVVFASYQPDVSQNPFADVVFAIEKDGAVLQKLPGISEDNSHGSESFLEVEAVTFLDYNSDGYDDIITICSYRPDTAIQSGTAISEIRYYTGSKNGTFTFEKQMSENANSALAEISIESAKGFIGAGKGISLEPWQQAYIDYLTHDSDVENQEGYVLIYLNADEIPELVEVGNCEASGCRIVNFSNGTVHVTQLNRLYFSYIKNEGLLCNSEGNMDYYYDLVYRMENEGLTLIASGYYGAEDNSNVQYDGEGNPIYYYEWEGVEMSAEDYAKALNNVYDISRATDGYAFDECCSVDEMLVILENF